MTDGGISMFKDGRTLSLKYSYTVNGISYTAERLSYGNVSGETKTRSRMKEWLMKYPAGKQVMVYHHPINHHYAVLEPGVSGELVANVVGALLATVGSLVRLLLEVTA